LAALEVTLNNTNPTIETLNRQTLPEVTQLARDLRELSVSLKSVTERVDQNGIGGVVSAPTLPDYQPNSRKRN
jgi:phospholipid/cholesterol/gamma-HCH transport system substrate-binding protein